MLIPKREIAELKNGSPEYDKAIDDVLYLLDNAHQLCSIVHKQTGLFFNGYDSPYPKGKNTLSKTSAKRYFCYGKTDEEILEKAFEGHITEKEAGRKYIWNKIVYSGSDINQILSEHYDDYKYLPLDDFYVKRE